jgi:hypothetical protein
MSEDEPIISMAKCEPKTENHFPYKCRVRKGVAELSPTMMAVYLEGIIKMYGTIRQRETGANAEQEEAVILARLVRRFRG